MKLRIAAKFIASVVLVGGFTTNALSYPYQYCHMNANGIKKFDTTRRFARNNFEFTNLENTRIHRAVQGWMRNRIGETSINFSGNTDSTGDINTVFINCDNAFQATGNAVNYDLCMYFGMSARAEHVIYRRGPVVVPQENINEPTNPFIFPNGVKDTTLGWVVTRIADPATGAYSAMHTDLCLGSVQNTVEGAGHGQPYFVAGRNVILQREKYPGFPHGATRPANGVTNQIANFSTNQPNTDINMVVAHEIGHVFGLEHPSTGANLTRSVMHASYADSHANYQGSVFNKRVNRVGQPLPIDAKNLRNLYPANSPALTSVGVQQWQWTGLQSSSWKLRAQSAYQSSSNQGSIEVTRAPYIQQDAYFVPLTIHNKGTTNRWAEGFVRFKKVGQNIFAPNSHFGAQMPPRSTAILGRWVEKPSPNNSANAGVYEIESFLTAPAVTSMSQQHPLRFNYRSQSGKQFTFF